MEIAIIIDFVDDAKGSGIATYASNLAKNLARLDCTNSYVLVHSQIGDIAKNTESLIIPRYRFPFGKEIRKFLLMPRALNGRRLDIVHETYHFGPFLLRSKYKKIVTVHDIVPLLFRDVHGVRSILRHKLGLHVIANRVDKIITVSNSTKRDLVEHLNISERKIAVVYEAADERYSPISKDIVEAVKKKYNIHWPFILFVGTLEPRKNIPMLIKAFYKMKNMSIGCKFRLVIAGKKGWKYEGIFNTVDKLNLQKDVLFTGYIPEEDMPALYNAATLFVYPSLYEGFGLPPLEAMACGTPVITSNTSSLPEVVGDAGIMIDPYDVDALAKAMYDMLTNDGLRENFVREGLKRARMFSWEKCAIETLKVYREVYDER